MGRRYARRASDERICRAQAASADASAGVQVKSVRCVAPDLPAPGDGYGPLTAMLAICGPAPDPPSPSAEVFFTNVALTARAPALTGTRTYRSLSAVAVLASVRPPDGLA